MTQKIIICLALLATCAAHAIIEMTDQATNAAPWNFEIYNKSGYAITVSVSYEGRMGQIFGAPMLIESSGKLRTVLTSTATPLVVKITRASKGDTKRRFAQQQFWIVPCPRGSECGKKMFLTYDENGLRPQTGTWQGLLGVTNSGLPLKNNIDQRYIFPEYFEFLNFKREMNPEEYM